MILPGGESNPALARSVGMTGACTNPIYYQGLYHISNGHIVGSAGESRGNGGAFLASATLPRIRTRKMGSDSAGRQDTQTDDDGNLARMFRDDEGVSKVR
jgi:hypothetical protein